MTPSLDRRENYYNPTTEWPLNTGSSKPISIHQHRVYHYNKPSADYRITIFNILKLLWVYFHRFRYVERRNTLIVNGTARYRLWPPWNTALSNSQCELPHWVTFTRLRQMYWRQGGLGCILIIVFLHMEVEIRFVGGLGIQLTEIDRFGMLGFTVLIQFLDG